MVATMQSAASSRRRGSSFDNAVRRSDHAGSWIPVALGLSALAGVTALAVRNGYGGHIKRRYEKTRKRQGVHASEPEVERSITIGKSADELYRYWRDPTTLPRVMAKFANVQASGGGRMRWKVEGPPGTDYEWESETVDDIPGQGLGWRTLPGAGIPNQGSVRFRPAPADRGTVVTLRFSFAAPEGSLGEAATKLLGLMPLGLAADGVLRRFKSLVETGEIPTLERQPAARADPR